MRDKQKEGMTIGFDLCLRKCLSDANLKCLNEDEVVALQSLGTHCVTRLNTTWSNFRRNTSMFTPRLH